jgi:hypothetical protein
MLMPEVPAYLTVTSIVIRSLYSIIRYSPGVKHIGSLDGPLDASAGTGATIAQTITVTTTIEVTKTSILTETIRETRTITEILRETVTLPPTTYIVTETKTVREPVVERGNVTLTITETTTVREVDLQTTSIIALATAILTGATLWLILRPRASRILP